MSSREFAEWMAFSQLEPIGGRRDDYLAALISSTLANTVRDPETRPTPFELGDFLPKWGRADPEQERLALQDKIFAVFRALGTEC